MKNYFFNKALITIHFFIFVSIIIMSFVPPFLRDELTHHLAIPKLWIKNGNIDPIPYLVPSFYPMNIDLLYVFPIYFNNTTIPKIIHYSFGLGTAWLIYKFIKKYTKHDYALLGTIIFLSTPIVVKLSISAYVDLGLMFFSWASLYHLLAWSRCPQSPKHFVFSAIFCGLSLGTKYNGIIVLLLLTLFVPIVYIRSASRNHFDSMKAIGYPILFFIAAMTIFSPWMIRNYHFTGNPIYPLFRNYIGNQTEQIAVSRMSMKPWLQRKLIYRESALETSLIPIRIFFQGKDDNPKFFDGKLNPMLCLFPILLFVIRRGLDKNQSLELYLLSAYSILFLLYAGFMVDMRIRYIAPILPPLVVLTTLGIREALGWVDGVGRKRIKILGHWVIVGGVFCLFFMNVQYIATLFKSVNPLPYIFGETTRESYLSNKLAEYPAIAFVNTIQDDNINILALFLGKRLYYFNQPVKFGTQDFASMVDEATDDRSLAMHLKNKGFTHFIVGIQHFKAWSNQVFDDNQKKIVFHWWREDCQLLFTKNGYAVFKLINQEEP